MKKLFLKKYIKKIPKKIRLKSDRKKSNENEILKKHYVKQNKLKLKELKTNLKD